MKTFKDLEVVQSNTPFLLALAFILSLIAFIFLIPTGSFAQGNIVTSPFGLTTPDNESSTIAVTNTFQTVFSATVGRKACTIQNNGTNKMLVYFNSDSAIAAKSITLNAGDRVYCDNNNTIIRTAVQITGTSGDAYYAVQW